MKKLLSMLLPSSDVIGIDLGTTNSVVSIMEDGKPKTIKNQEGKPTTPSVVGYTKDGDILVGEAAQRQAVTNPARTIFSAKRFIGTAFTERKSEAFSVPYTVRPNQEEQTAFEIDGRLVSPEEVSAEILSKLKAAAEEYLGKSVKKAVITVPAYFNDRQRTATKDAARIAGLEVEAIINEPTAAALAYAQGLEKDKTIAVYDLGGGTFDFTILKVGDESLEVIATGGNSHLGGDNIDEHIITKLVAQFSQENGGDVTRDPQAMQRLKEAAVRAKIDLSASQSTEINLPFLTATESGPIHLNSQISRAEFEKDITPIINKTLEPMAQVLESSGLGKSDLSEIILVGGSTRIPLVRKKVEEFFGKKPLSNVETDEIVAHGAAIKAAIEKGDIKTELIDVTSLSLGVKTIGDRLSIIIPANTKLPSSFTKDYTTTADNQTEAEVVVLQGNDPVASKNKSLATFVVEGIPPMPAGKPRIDVTFTIDADGILNVSAVDQDGNKKDITVRDSGMLEKQEVDRKIKERKMDLDERKKLNAERSELGENLKKAEKALYALPEGSKAKDKLNILIEEGNKKLQESIKVKDIAQVNRSIQAVSDIDAKDTEAATES